MENTHKHLSSDVDIDPSYTCKKSGAEPPFGLGLLLSRHKQPVLGAETEAIAKTDVFVQAKVRTSTPQETPAPHTGAQQQSLCGTSEEGRYANHAWCLGSVHQEERPGEANSFSV